MNTRSPLNSIILVATLGVCSWGCQVTSGGSGSGGTSGGGVTSSGGMTDTGGQVGAGGVTDSGGATGSGGATTSKTFDPSKPPCDIYAEDGGPCVAAHSTIRRLSSTYNGSLYQIRVGGSKSGTGGTTTEIGFDADGFADAATQDAACASSSCTISIIYDQSGKGNDLAFSPAGGGAKPSSDNEANAKGIPITIGSRTLYGIHIVAGVGYRNNTPNGTATGDDAETEYMVVAGDFYNGGCCFDYGNMETNSHDNGEGTMEAVYFGNCTIWNTGGGNGPWIMGDLENGLWAGNTSPYESNETVPGDWKFVTGMVKGDAAGRNHWAIKKGNAQSGDLIVAFDGQRPSARYNPMIKEGAIGLGTGGDNSNAAQGNWFEGLMTAHFSSDAADNAVQANIVSVYGQ